MKGKKSSYLDKRLFDWVGRYINWFVGAFVSVGITMLAFILMLVAGMSDPFEQAIIILLFILPLTALITGVIIIFVIIPRLKSKKL